MAKAKEPSSVFGTVSLVIADMKDGYKTRHKTLVNRVMNYAPAGIKREHVEQALNMTPLQLIELLESENN